MRGTGVQGSLLFKFTNGLFYILGVITQLQKRALVVSPERQCTVFSFTSISVALMVCILIHRSGIPDRKQKAFRLRDFEVLILARRHRVSIIVESYPSHIFSVIFACIRPISRRGNNHSRIEVLSSAGSTCLMRDFQRQSIICLVISFICTLQFRSIEIHSPRWRN